MTAILALDTATPSTVVAVTRGDEVWEARHDPAPGERPGHQTRLLALALDVLGRADLDWRDLDRIAIGVGPGSFTGLRVGVATARGLAQAQDVSLVGINTLASLAHGAREQQPDAPLVLAVLDARRGEVFAAGWSGSETLLAPRPLAPEELAERVRGWEPSALAVGDGAIRFREPLEAVGTVVPGDDSPLHRVWARHHCRLAERVEIEARDAVLPDYLRLPDAELTRRARTR